MQVALIAKTSGDPVLSLVPAVMTQLQNRINKLLVTG
jgi:hypothetical protein